jgi:D-3-phosphoglycerate dehydrogenase / 2-oxoglutarate reductase
VNNFRVEFKPEGHLIYIINRDAPDVVGKVGTLLGDREINIAEYNLARIDTGARAMAIITVDSRLDPDTLSFLKSYREMIEVRQVKL